jgi:hypothetical protein
MAKKTASPKFERIAPEALGISVGVPADLEAYHAFLNSAD